MSIFPRMTGRHIAARLTGHAHPSSLATVATVLVLVVVALGGAPVQSSPWPAAAGSMVAEQPAGAMPLSLAVSDNPAHLSPAGDSGEYTVPEGRPNRASCCVGASIGAIASLTAYLPIVARPVADLKSLVSRLTVALPHPLGGAVGSWCTWGWCTLSPRLYHEPLADGRTLVGWTDSSGNGHVSLIGAAGIEQTHDFPALSVRGLVAHSDNRFAVLLWSSSSKIMWLSKRNANGSEVWKTNVKGSLTSFNPGIGDSRLAYGNGRYAAYFAVHGDSGWVEGHEGDQLTYVSDSGGVQSGGWSWGCSHSMAELVSYHPALAQFAPICASDCYASKGVLTNDSEVVYPSDGNCGGLVSAQLGQAAFDGTSWKVVFSALSRPGYVGKGIGLATVNGSFQSSYVWLTNTDGSSERDPVLARLGTDLQTNRYLVGWTTTDNGVYWLAVINGSGGFVAGPEEASSTGIAWGNRDDSFRTRADGSVSWVQGDPSSATLRLFRFDGSAYLP